MKTDDIKLLVIEIRNIEFIREHLAVEYVINSGEFILKLNNNYSGHYKMKKIFNNQSNLKKYYKKFMKDDKFAFDEFFREKYKEEHVNKTIRLINKSRKLFDEKELSFIDSYKLIKETINNKYQFDHYI